MTERCIHTGIRGALTYVRENEVWGQTFSQSVSLVEAAFKGRGASDWEQGDIIESGTRNHITVQ